MRPSAKAFSARSAASVRCRSVTSCSSQRSDQEIVHYALGGDEAQSHPDMQDRARAATAYQDWRTEVMGLVGIES